MLLRIDNANHPLFTTAYAELDAQFGAAHELEECGVIASRFTWNHAPPQDGYALRYAMAALVRDGAIVAVCDYTLAVNVETSASAASASTAVVHLSHLLVDPTARGGGVGTRMLDVPVDAARAWLHARAEMSRPIVIAAETEPPTNAINIARLRFYHRAGYRTVDPGRMNYLQPDFRPTEIIDATGGPRPLPMRLLVRRFDADAVSPSSLQACDVRHVLAALHHVYARTFRPADMAAARVTLRGDATVDLLVSE